MKKMEKNFIKNIWESIKNGGVFPMNKTDIDTLYSITKRYGLETESEKIKEPEKRYLITDPCYEVRNDKRDKFCDEVISREGQIPTYTLPKG